MAICHNKAIRMKQNDEGFYYPDISADKCVHCGMCETVCPVNKKKETIIPLEVISGCSNTEDMRLQGSSGGIFPELAYHFVSLDGIVYGVAFDENTKEAYYCGSDKVTLENCSDPSMSRREMNIAFFM